MINLPTKVLMCAAMLQCAAIPSSGLTPTNTNYLDDTANAQKIASMTVGDLLKNPIPASAAVDPQSDVMVKELHNVAQTKGFVMSTKEWTVPVYVADNTTPRQSVQVFGRPPGANLDKSFVHNVEQLKQGIPIPNNAAPDPMDDAHMTVVDHTTNCQYDLYGARKTDGQWQAEWMNSTKIPFSGIYPYGLSSRATGFSALAGAIWPHELKSGSIEHALVFNYLKTRAGNPVWPATASDGRYTGENTIPEGALLRLDPSLDLSTLSLNPTERTIAQALQKYGMYLVDSGGAVGLYAVSDSSFTQGYGSGVNLPYHVLEGIPTDRFQVMELPDSQPVVLKTVDSGCEGNVPADPTPEPTPTPTSEPTPTPTNEPTPTPTSEPTPTPEPTKTSDPIPPVDEPPAEETPVETSPKKSKKMPVKRGHKSRTCDDTVCTKRGNRLS